jgi:hypothetical protein
MTVHPGTQHRAQPLCKRWDEGFKRRAVDRRTVIGALQARWAQRRVAASHEPLRFW